MARLALGIVIAAMIVWPSRTHAASCHTCCLGTGPRFDVTECPVGGGLSRGDLRDVAKCLDEHTTQQKIDRDDWNLRVRRLEASFEISWFIFAHAPGVSRLLRLQHDLLWTEVLLDEGQRLQRERDDEARSSRLDAITRGECLDELPVDALPAVEGLCRETPSAEHRPWCVATEVLNERARDTWRLRVAWAFLIVAIGCIVGFEQAVAQRRRGPSDPNPTPDRPT